MVSWGIKMQRNNVFGNTIKTVGLAAPASSCKTADLQAGIRVLEQHGINVISGENIFRKGSFSYLSADDPFRAEDFNRLAENESIDAILCVRGGYGTPRILDRINYDILKARDLPVIGFSDITALHLAMLSRNAGRCVASQMAARLPEAIKNPKTLAGMQRVYSRLDGAVKPFHKVGRKLCVLNGNKAVEGGVIPLNLTLAAALCGTDYMPSMKNRIVVLEEVGEPVRKIDRMLNQLLYSQFFNMASAVVFAQFTDCGETAERNRLLRDFATRVDCPVFSGLDYGHALPSHSFLFDEPCRIEDGAFFLQ